MLLFFGSSKMKTTMDGKDLEETFQLLEEENKVFGFCTVGALYLVSTFPGCEEKGFGEIIEEVPRCGGDF